LAWLFLANAVVFGFCAGHYYRHSAPTAISPSASCADGNTPFYGSCFERQSFTFDLRHAGGVCCLFALSQRQSFTFDLRHAEFLFGDRDGGITLRWAGASRQPFHGRINFLRFFFFRPPLGKLLGCRTFPTLWRVLRRSRPSLSLPSWRCAFRVRLAFLVGSAGIPIAVCCDSIVFQ
jgi:hypothetical protein